MKTLIFPPIIFYVKVIQSPTSTNSEQFTLMLVCITYFWPRVRDGAKDGGRGSMDSTDCMILDPWMEGRLLLRAKLHCPSQRKWIICHFRQETISSCID